MRNVVVAQCSECRIDLARSEIASTYQRTVISPRNANKRVGPVSNLCNDCKAAGEWKQELYRVSLQAEQMLDAVKMGRSALVDEILARQPAWEAKLVREAMEKNS
jgi:hypothetical protein